MRTAAHDRAATVTRSRRAPRSKPGRPVGPQANGPAGQTTGERPAGQTSGERARGSGHGRTAPRVRPRERPRVRPRANGPAGQTTAPPARRPGGAARRAGDISPFAWSACGAKGDRRRQRSGRSLCMRSAASEGRYITRGGEREGLEGPVSRVSPAEPAPARSVTRSRAPRSIAIRGPAADHRDPRTGCGPPRSADRLRATATRDRDPPAARPPAPRRSRRRGSSGQAQAVTSVSKCSGTSRATISTGAVTSSSARSAALVIIT